MEGRKGRFCRGGEEAPNLKFQITNKFQIQVTKRGRPCRGRREKHQIQKLKSQTSTNVEWTNDRNAREFRSFGLGHSIFFWNLVLFKDEILNHK